MFPFTISSRTFRGKKLHCFFTAFGVRFVFLFNVTLYETRPKAAAVWLRYIWLTLVCAHSEQDVHSRTYDSLASMSESSVSTVQGPSAVREATGQGGASESVVQGLSSTVSLLK